MCARPAPKRSRVVTRRCGVSATYCLALIAVCVAGAAAPRCPGLSPRCPGLSLHRLLLPLRLSAITSANTSATDTLPRCAPPRCPTVPHYVSRPPPPLHSLTAPIKDRIPATAYMKVTSVTSPDVTSPSQRLMRYAPLSCPVHMHCLPLLLCLLVQAYELSTLTAKLVLLRTALLKVSSSCNQRPAPPHPTALPCHHHTLPSSLRPSRTSTPAIAHAKVMSATSPDVTPPSRNAE